MKIIKNTTWIVLLVVSGACAGERPTLGWTGGAAEFVREHPYLVATCGIGLLGGGAYVWSSRFPKAELKETKEMAAAGVVVREKKKEEGDLMGAVGGQAAALTENERLLAHFYKMQLVYQLIFLPREGWTFSHIDEQSWDGKKQVVWSKFVASESLYGTSRTDTQRVPLHISPEELKSISAQIDAQQRLSRPFAGLKQELGCPEEQDIVQWCLRQLEDLGPKLQRQGLLKN